MKRWVLFIFVVLISLKVDAQLKQVYDELKRINFNMPDSTQRGWDRDGEMSLRLGQSLYDNWNGSSNNNIELSTTLNEKLKYQTKNMIWDNYLIADYSLNKARGQGIRKTQDRIEFNSVVGVSLPNNWATSFFLNLRTQLTNSYDYNRDIDKEYRLNGFLAPLYATTGPGIMWRRDSKLNFNIAPVTCKVTYINGDIYRYDRGSSSFKSDNEIDVLGIGIGKKIDYQLGFYSSIIYEFNLAKNIKVENRLTLYSNYLINPTNIDFDYTMRMNLGINKLLSTQIIIQTRYDDDEYPGIQGRESIGVGVNFKI